MTEYSKLTSKDLRDGIDETIVVLKRVEEQLRKMGAVETQSAVLSALYESTVKVREHLKADLAACKKL